MTNEITELIARHLCVCDGKDPNEFVPGSYITEDGVVIFDDFHTRKINEGRGVSYTGVKIRRWREYQAFAEKCAEMVVELTKTTGASYDAVIEAAVKKLHK